MTRADNVRLWSLAPPKLIITDSGEQVRQVANWAWNEKPPPTLDGRPNRVAFNKTDAVDFVRLIADILLAEMRAYVTSPKARDRREKLENLEKAARSLRDLLATEGERSGLLVMTQARTGFYELRYAPNSSARSYSQVSPGRILSRPLEMLIDALGQTKEDRRGVLRGQSHEYVSNRLRGDPRRSLGRNCAWLLLQCRGEEALKKDRDGAGLVLDLANKVWMLAVKAAPPDGHLDRMVRDGTTDVRDRAWTPDRTVFVPSLIEPKFVF